MKKFKISMMAVIVLALTACSSDTEESQVSLTTNNKLIVQGKEFAKIHNDCLANIYISLISVKTRGKSVSIVPKSKIIEAANLYITKHKTQTRAANEIKYITEDMYKKNIEDLRKEIPNYELNYINRCISEKENSNSIFKDVINDNKLSTERKQAIICFITTYEASSKYWQQNIQKWDSNLMNGMTTRSVRFNWRDVATADAYWGYMGMLSSGLNVWVGGGSAAVGSAFACLK